MAAASTSKSCNGIGNHEYNADSKIGQMVFEQQVLLPLFTRIKYKGCRSSDFLDIKQALLYIFDSFKYQKRNYLVDIFLKNNVYDLLFPKLVEKPKPKPKETRKRPNVIVFKDVPWFCKEKRQRTEAMNKTLQDEARYNTYEKEDDDDDSSSVVALSPVRSVEDESPPPPVDECDKVVKVEDGNDTPLPHVISTFDEFAKITESVCNNVDSKRKKEEKNATDDLVKLIVDTYSKEPPPVAAINVKEESSVEPLEISSFDVQCSSSSYLDAPSDAKVEPFVTVDYDISPAFKKRFSKNLEGHNLYFVVAKYYYHYWDIFKDWSNRTAEITRQRAQAWNDIFYQMERDGFKDFNRESLPLNFRKFVSKLRTKKRNQLSGTGPPTEFTQEEEEILEYENSYLRLKRKCITIKD